ncbi:hypothetical protein AVEN_22391-1 [Araneus ventricosus]|uniref:HAT C-terminal dimerisation domain-containing protein n=1 Tax=Araneus ventricosus TaxID=182803 RepID=A0A4Y2PN69_ARAVE|nr:hypothetical protein AVEN_22391-1 [Araneus ventricosus]
MATLKDPSKKIRNFDVEEKKNYLPTKSVFMGDDVKRLSTSAPKSRLAVVKKFQKNVLKAYVECSQTLQKKMHLVNLLLQSASAIDSVCRKHPLSLTLMKGLPDLVTNVSSVGERDAYDFEVHKYLAASLRQPQQKEPVDNWWMKVKNSRQFPLVSNIVCVVLTCFHGPKVESSFSIANLVVTSETNRLSIESFDAIQTVKYEFMSEKKSAVQLYKKKEYLKDKVDRNLCKNMNSASRNYRAEVLSKKIFCDKQSSTRKKLESKEAANKISAKAAKLQRNIHLKKMRSQA